MIEVGKINKLRVLRKSDLGYMLTSGDEEVLMHFKQSNKELINGEEVSVYIYTDKENRKTATMQEPVLLMEKPNFAKVVQVIPGIGVFVNNNTPKDLFVSKDYLPYDSNLWPVIDDNIFVELKYKKNALVAKPVNRFDVIALSNNVKYAEGEKKDANVLRIAEKGIGLITRDLVYVFVTNHQLRKKYRLGEEVSVTITKMVDKEAYGTLNEHKEILMDTDKELILDYLNKHHGVMKLTAKSSAEEVEKIFGISRKAFKRAYGALYKEELISFDDEKTYLIKK